MTPTELRELLNGLCDILGCTRWMAARIVAMAERDGYAWRSR